MDSVAPKVVNRKKPCVVPGCVDKLSTRHRFPKRTNGPTLFNMWLLQINNPKLFTMMKKKIYDNCVVCDRHFEEEDKVPCSSKLIAGAIPKLFLPNPEDRTEAIFNILDTPIDLPTDPTDLQLIDKEVLLNSDAFELHTVEAQDSFLSSVFRCEKKYPEPEFPIRLPENESTVNDTNDESEQEYWEVFLDLENAIVTSTTDIIKIEVEDIEEIEGIGPIGQIQPIEPIQQIGQIEPIQPIGQIEPIEPIEQTEQTEPIEPTEPPLPEKPYFKSVKSYLVDSRNITEVCRICFRSILDEKMIKLYEEDHSEDTNNTRNMLKLVLPDLDLEMYPNSVLCTKCYELLIYSFQLKEIWLTTEEKLQKIISKKKGVTNRDADLVIVAKAMPKDKNKVAKDVKIAKYRNNKNETNRTNLRNEVMHEISSHNDTTTNLEVFDDHSVLDIEHSSGQENRVQNELAELKNKLTQTLLRNNDHEVSGATEKCPKPSSSNNPNKNQNVCNISFWSLGQENVVKVKLPEQTNILLERLLSQNSSTTNHEINGEINLKELKTKLSQRILSYKDSLSSHEVSEDLGNVDTENSKKSSASNVSNNKNQSNKKILNSRQTSGVDIKVPKQRTPLVQRILSGNDSSTNHEVSVDHDYLDIPIESTTNNVNKNLNICSTQIWSSGQKNCVEIELAEIKNKLDENSSKELNTSNVNNIYNKTILDLVQENDVEIRPAKITNKVMQDILSHNDSTTNLEVAIYHGDLDCETPIRPRNLNTANKNPNTANENPNTVNKNAETRAKGIWGLGPYICEKCGKIIPKLKALKRHLKIHNKVEHLMPRKKREKDKMCDICGRLFFNNRALSLHTEKHGRILDCSICHKVFNCNKYLQDHIQRRHMKQYEYSQCHLCGKKLAYKRSLHLHLLTHTGEKPHVCNICNKRFFFPCNLRKHLLKHTSDMLSCEYCGKALKYQHSLQKHIRIYHKNEADYRCEFCERPYWKRVDLMKHKIRIHGWKQETEISENT